MTTRKRVQLELNDEDLDSILDHVIAVATGRIRAPHEARFQACIALLDLIDDTDPRLGSSASVLQERSKA